MCKLHKSGVQGNTILLLWTNLNEAGTVSDNEAMSICLCPHKVKKVLAIHLKKTILAMKKRQADKLQFVSS